MTTGHIFFSVTASKEQCRKWRRDDVSRLGASMVLRSKASPLYLFCSLMAVPGCAKNLCATSPLQFVPGGVQPRQGRITNRPYTPKVEDFCWAVSLMKRQPFFRPFKSVILIFFLWLTKLWGNIFTAYKEEHASMPLKDVADSKYCHVVCKLKTATSP